MQNSFEAHESAGLLSRLEKVLQLYQEMLDRNIRPDSITYNTLMFAGAQAKMPGKVLVSILTRLQISTLIRQYS